MLRIIKRTTSLLWLIIFLLVKSIFISLSIMGYALMALIIFFIVWDFRDEEKVFVAVIDSGINENFQIFNGKIKGGYNFYDGTKDVSDLHGHGSYISSIILQQSPKVNIIPIKKFKGGEGKGAHSSLPIIYGIVKGADIINMSYSEPPDFITHKIIQIGVKKGIIFVSSSGNDGKKEINYPANYPEVIAVGSSDVDDQLSYFSNISTNLTYLAPGENISVLNEHGEIEYKSGTSISSAVLSGKIAHLKTNQKKITQQEIESVLKKSSKNKSYFDATIYVLPIEILRGVYE